MLPFRYKNIIVTDIPVKEDELQYLANTGKSVYDTLHRRIYPAAMILNWNYSLVKEKIKYNKLFHTVNITKCKVASNDFMNR